MTGIVREVFRETGTAIAGLAEAFLFGIDDGERYEQQQSEVHWRSAVPTNSSQLP